MESFDNVGRHLFSARMAQVILRGVKDRLDLQIITRFFVDFRNHISQFHSSDKSHDRLERALKDPAEGAGGGRQGRYCGQSELMLVEYYTVY